MLIQLKSYFLNQLIESATEHICSHWESHTKRAHNYLLVYINGVEYSIKDGGFVSSNWSFEFSTIRPEGREKLQLPIFKVNTLHTDMCIRICRDKDVFGLNICNFTFRVDQERPHYFRLQSVMEKKQRIFFLSCVIYQKQKTVEKY